MDFDRFATTVSRYCGKPWIFASAVTLILIWLMFGPMAGFSDTWQLIANTVTTLVTFLMGFILLYTQNRDTKAVMLKLDVLIYAMAKADNQFIGAEEWSGKKLEEEVKRLKDAVSKENNKGRNAR